jgi:putative acetyltransferase
MIRAARPDEYEALLDIWLQASRVGHFFLGEAVLKSQLSRVREDYLPNAETWTAVQGSPVGFVSMLGPRIGGLFVAPVALGRGIGRALVEHVASRHAPLTVDVYEANKDALAFYERLGFAVRARTPFDDEGRPFPLLRLTRPTSVDC